MNMLINFIKKARKSKRISKKIKSLENDIKSIESDIRVKQQILNREIEISRSCINKIQKEIQEVRLMCDHDFSKSDNYVHPNNCSVCGKSWYY